MVDYIRSINQAIALDHCVVLPQNQYILDLAHMTGIRLPARCLKGDCSACVAKTVNSEQ